MEDIRLFINGTQVDLSDDISIRYTYTEDDLNNPTAVKNSFSKTIVLYGTPTNNDLFGHYWNIERTTGGGYNASKKAPFELYVGTELYESGYIKLDNVDCVSGVYRYNCTLYGGLGDFFYNLSTNNNTGDKLKLSDIEFDNDLSFTINIDTVKEAWDALRNKTAGKWQDINFMTAYNGYPDDFDVNKVIVNTSGTTLQKTAYEDGKSYGTTQGFVLGELPENMTEWEIRDLRSYNQRPCIRMKSIINACCNPINNGGYTVIKDPEFFNENNPYWENTFLTLPMIQSLKYTSEEQVLSGATLISHTTTGTTDGMMYQDLSFDIGEWGSTTTSQITVIGKIKLPSIYQYTSHIWFWNWNGDDYHTGWALFGSLFCQMIAMNGDTVVGASNAFNLTTPIRHNGNLYYGHNDRYSDGHKFTPYMNKGITNTLGMFESDGFHLEDSSSPYDFYFTISNINSPITGLKMVYYWGANSDKINKAGVNRLIQTPYDDGWVTHSLSTMGVGASEININDIRSNAKAVLGESIGRTGTQVTKNLLLDTDASPCDYLLSYAKMFGLYWLKDIESKTIHLLTRKSFYQRDTVENLSKYIDYSKSHTITPIVFDSKWFEFKQEQDETQFSENYKLSKGVDYGSKILNTGYEFNSEKKNLLKDNVIRSGIEGLEKSKYFSAYNDDKKARPWMGMGFKYNLTAGESNYEVAVTSKAGDYLSLNEDSNLKYYDLYPKLQFRDKGNDGTDGNNVLVFFSGFKNIKSGRTNPLTYMLTDDSLWQTQLNEGKPCWLFTPQETVSGKRIAYDLDSLPVFERYLTTDGSGSVWRSLDFGSPQELFIPSYNISEDANIYTNFWKTYLEDLYNVDTKILKCFVKIKGKPSPDWIRRFYWFDNTIWRLNKINDWCVGSEDTTEMIFVKVQDILSYTNKEQEKPVEFSLVPEFHNIGPAGGDVPLNLFASGLTWKISSTKGTIMSITEGTGTKALTATFPPNTGNTNIVWNIAATSSQDGQMINTKASITQSYVGATTFEVSPQDMLIGYSGGDVDIDIIWYNQGTDYITGYTKGSGFDFDVDISKANEGVITFSFDPNTGNTTLSNYCEFRTRDGLSARIGFDQVVREYVFDNTGGTASFNIQYNTGVNLSGLPFWVDLKKTGSTYTIIAKPNTYEGEEKGKLTLSKAGSSASIDLTLQAGSATSMINVFRIQGTGDVSPSGETIYLKVESNRQPWNAVSSESWATPTKVGDIINLEVEENEDDAWRQTIITVTDAIGNTYNYTVGQDTEGGGGGDKFSVNPTSIIFEPSGGTATITIRTDSGWIIE